MWQKIKRGLGVFFFLIVFFISQEESLILAAEGQKSDSLDLDAKSSILIEYETGEILYGENEDTRLPPASITKVMTMALVLEQVEAGKLKMDDIVTASANAKSMGGTQIYLEEGEQMTVYNMMMAVALASANDAAVALGEHVADGSMEAFVQMMNDKAKELGMEDTTFKNPSGLPDDGHLTTAHDIAVMTQYLLTFPQGREFIGTNMYPIREGKRQYQMVNTNDLLTTYEGCIGGKTGYTGEAKCCLTAAATRDGITLIAVTLGEATSKGRNKDTAALLDYGFENYRLLKEEVESVMVDPIKVTLGMEDKVEVEVLKAESITRVVKKDAQGKIEQTITVEEELKAPVKKGQKVGQVTVTLDGEEIATYDLTAKETVKKRSFWRAVRLLLERIFSF